MLKPGAPSRYRFIDLATTLEFLGRRLQEDGNTDAAIAAIRRSIEVSREGVRLDAKNLSARVQTMASYEALLWVLGEAGRREQGGGRGARVGRGGGGAG